jgi:hypothetical protein
MLFGMAGAVASSRLVGRTAELGRLEAAFAYARGWDPDPVRRRGGRGRQTRLVTRFASQIRQGGGQLLARLLPELGQGEEPAPAGPAPGRRCSYGCQALAQAPWQLDLPAVSASNRYRVRPWPSTRVWPSLEPRTSTAAPMVMVAPPAVAAGAAPTGPPPLLLP